LTGSLSYFFSFSISVVVGESTMTKVIVKRCTVRLRSSRTFCFSRRSSSLFNLQYKIVIKVTMPNAKSRVRAMVVAAKTNGMHFNSHPFVHLS
jgi:hypothetical protein